jgi:hypothetical protein
MLFINWLESLCKKEGISQTDLAYNELDRETFKVWGRIPFHSLYYNLLGIFIRLSLMIPWIKWSRYSTILIGLYSKLKDKSLGRIVEYYFFIIEQKIPILKTEISKDKYTVTIGIEDLRERFEVAIRRY